MSKVTLIVEDNGDGIEAGARLANVLVQAGAAVEYLNENIALFEAAKKPWVPTASGIVVCLRIVKPGNTLTP